jgi:hypothetical protein
MGRAGSRRRGRESRSLAVVRRIGVLQEKAAAPGVRGSPGSIAPERIG